MTNETEDNNAEYNPDRQQTPTREQRREQADQEWRKHPINTYRDSREDDLTEKDLNYRIKTIRQFEEFLLDEIAPGSEHEIKGVRDAIEEDVEKFRDTCLKPDLDIGTIEKRLQFLKEFYKKLEEKKANVGNPARGPLKEFRDNHDRDPDRPYIPFRRMQQFVTWLDRPFSRAVWLLPLKNGVRKGEEINIDLRCLHIDHPVFWEIIEDHDISLDPRIRNKPDTILIYGEFNAGTEIPNEDTPGFSGDGEVRETGNKRKQENGSIIPVDSELKTALIEWLLVRPPTHTHDVPHDVHPLFAIGGSKDVRRIGPYGLRTRLWGRSSFIDNIQRFSTEESLDECPACGGSVVEEILDSGEKTGRRFRCVDCHEVHWRPIHWESGLKTEEKVTHHQCRHYFSSAHSPENSGLHDGVIPDSVRKKEIRGDSNQQGDTEDQVYIEGQYKDFDDDVRKPYLEGIYKFGVYDTVIPAVGEGWID